jgi:S-adenosylmethionine:tRNA ribosyltransferase-isomerase
VRTADFHFELPPELIAQAPVKQRDRSRLLVLHRRTSAIIHRGFRDLLHYLCAGDVLVLNDSRVIPARIDAVNATTGGDFELLLLEQNARNSWWAMVRPARRARINTQLHLKNRTGQLIEISASVVETRQEGQRLLRFEGAKDIAEHLAEIGQMPVPPYIRRTSLAELSEDFERYQTVYAQSHGSVAAPTAGLHFTVPLLNALRRAGIRVCAVTLHVGPGTFGPVRVDRVEDHVLHEERFFVSEETAQAVNSARAEGRRVIAVGTTSLRVLESCMRGPKSPIEAAEGRTRLFIHPPFQFRAVDALLTNFHLPCSSLLMLVSAFAAPGETRGRELILNAYGEAIRERYRFFSYGDAMFIV